MGDLSHSVPWDEQGGSAKHNLPLEPLPREGLGTCLQLSRKKTAIVCTYLFIFSLLPWRALESHQQDCNSRAKIWCTINLPPPRTYSWVISNLLATCDLTQPKLSHLWSPLDAPGGMAACSQLSRWCCGSQLRVGQFCLMLCRYGQWQPIPPVEVGRTHGEWAVLPVQAARALCLCGTLGFHVK